MNDTIVTGASGFIGSHLMKRLPTAQSLAHHEISFGNYSSEKIFFLSTYGNMIHQVVHGYIIQANVVDLITVVKRGLNGWICYMSTSSVKLPIQTPYSRAKRAGEEILQALPEIKSCIVRPYSVTGVGEQKEHLIPTLIRSCMTGEEMPFDPYPVHDFIDVEDVVDGLVKLSETKETGVFEFGSGVPFSNKDVKKIVENICDRKANVKEVKGLRPYDSSAWCCYQPHFTPRKTLRKSIEEMVEAYERP